MFFFAKTHKIWRLVGVDDCGAHVMQTVEQVWSVFMGGAIGCCGLGWKATLCVLHSRFMWSCG